MNVKLAAPVMLQDDGIKKKSQKKGTKLIVSYQQLRPIYKASQIHKVNDKILKVMDEEKNLLVGSIREANHSVLQETLTNSCLSQTRTTKIRQV